MKKSRDQIEKELEAKFLADIESLDYRALRGLVGDVELTEVGRHFAATHPDRHLYSILEPKHGELVRRLLVPFESEDEEIRQTWAILVSRLIPAYRLRYRLLDMHKQGKISIEALKLVFDTLLDLRLPERLALAMSRGLEELEL